MQKPDVEVSIWIARSPEDIWNYFYDASNEVLWRYGVYLAQWISDPPYGIGSIGFHIVALWGIYPWKVTEFEEQRIMSWNVIDGRFKGARAGYRISPEEAGSRITMHFSANQNSFLRIMLFLMKWLFIRQMTGDLKRLKTIMEA